MNTLRELIFGRRGARGGAASARRPRQVRLACDTLEGRVTPAHFGGFISQAAVQLHAAAHHGHHGEDGGGTGSTSSTNTALTTATQTLRTDVQKVELASGTTVGQLTAIRAAFQTLSSDGLHPSSRSALASFENSLVTAFASGTTLAGDTTLLNQFEALYTSSPTAQQTTDLTTAYNALAAAVTASNITSSDISTINTDWSAVQAAGGHTTSTTYPYFSLVTGDHADLGRGGCD
jgi:hypothetical protein